jgi:hypothetical protein
MASPMMLLETGFIGKKNRIHKKLRDIFANPVAKPLFLNHYQNVVRIVQKAKEKRARRLTMKKRRTELLS